MNRGIDHLVLAVADLEAAAGFYRRLGFTTTPRAQHAWGTDNCLVQLGGNFLELLTVARPHLIAPPAASGTEFSFGAHNQAFLTRREGMSMLVFESRDAEADRAEFIARGLPPWESFHFEREAALPDGSRVKVSFSLAFASDPTMPETAFFTCRQHAPDLFWKPDYQRHANGATLVSEVVMLADPPSGLADYLGRMQEADAVSRDGDGIIVATPRGTISVVTPDGARERFAGVDLGKSPPMPCFLGYRVHVLDVAAVAGRLGEEGIPHTASGGAVRIAPADAFGALIEFHAG